MEKYTKRYIRFVDNIYNQNMIERHFPSRKEEYIIAKYGEDMEYARKKLSNELQGCLGLVAIQFFDKSYIILDGVNYESEPYNYSGLIYFGDRLDMSVVDEGNLVSKRCCKVDGVSYILRDEDMSYDEYVDTYKNSLGKQKVKK